MTEIFHALSPYLPAHVFDIIMVPMQILLLLFTLCGGMGRKKS